MFRHQFLEQPVEHEGIDDESPLGFKRGPRHHEIAIRPGFRASQRARVAQRGCQPGRKIIVADFHDLHPVAFARLLRRVRRIFALRAPQRHDPGAEQVVDGVKGPKPPRQFSQIVDDHIVYRQHGRRPFALGLKIRPVAPQILNAQCFVPVVERTRPVPHEQHGLGQVHARLKQAPTAGSRVQEGRVDLRCLKLPKLIGRGRLQHRQYLQLEISPFRNTRKLFLDANGFFSGCLMRLHAAPGFVGRLRARLGHPVQQHRLHAERFGAYGVGAFRIPQALRPRALCGRRARERADHAGSCRERGPRAEKCPAIHV